MANDIVERNGEGAEKVGLTQEAPCDGAADAREVDPRQIDLFAEAP